MAFIDDMGSGTEQRSAACRRPVHDEQSLDVDQGATAVVCSQIMKRCGPPLLGSSSMREGTLSE